MTNKHIYQLVSKDGKPVAPATSAPGWFIHDGMALEKHPDIPWGRPFGEPCSGNKVDFYVTGEEYFTAVAAAIKTARKSIYITGWQVNFDVELAGGQTLFQCLQKAIDANPALRVYVMPWMSPKVGVDTGDFETMLAVFHLNAALPPPTRAFALPAIAQSDMPGGLGIGFSHHQKLVVIDDERAFVGGIDLAYGRRDDGKFSLAANGRVGNELYNPCIPPIHELSSVEQTNFLTRAELLAACFEGAAGSAGTFLTSAPARPVAVVSDAIKSASSAGRDAQKAISDWWETKDLMPRFVRQAQDAAVDAAQDASRWAYRKLDKELRGKIEALRQTGSAHAATVPAALLAWLNNSSMEQLPAELRKGSVELIEAFTMATLIHLCNPENTRKEKYPNLHKLGKIVPASGKVISAGQPRMPWHDVHSSITGPAVSDLSKNFVRRWNGIAHRYERSYIGVTANSGVRAVFDALGLRSRSAVKIPRLSAPPPMRNQPKTGKCWVQVLRSAPEKMQRDEATAESPGKGKHMAARAENSCLKAMLTAIHSAQKFIYIEGQFFQSAHGTDIRKNAEPSGPLAALTDITTSPGYKKYAKQLGIVGVAPADIPAALRWSQVDDVRNDANGKGEAFWNDLQIVLKNTAAIEASRLLGKPQESVHNPIGEALARRIEAATYRREPFHVYMVLPVHPEGTLNSVNIMAQVHLTMQSLMFGSDSLVNRIRRALYVVDLQNNMGISKAEAKAKAAELGADKIAIEIEDKWKRYLTLLNLRSWTTLKNRPVTEQIYVHSKLLIADDRVALLGSANINDRSQLGDRDSELAVIVRDDEQMSVKLDGKREDRVSTRVHYLRVSLWKKLLGLTESAGVAPSLADVVAKPAAADTFAAIQRVALANAVSYKKSFPFLASPYGRSSSIWPTWNNGNRRLGNHMPFNERFWRADDVHDKSSSWDAAVRAVETPPTGIQGFIVAFPDSWTDRENNLSHMNMTLMAENKPLNDDDRRLGNADDTTADIRHT